MASFSNGYNTQNVYMLQSVFHYYLIPSLGVEEEDFAVDVGGVRVVGLLKNRGLGIFLKFEIVEGLKSK